MNVSGGVVDVIEIVLKPAAVLAAALIVSLAFRKQSAALRHWVLAAGIVLATVTPGLIFVAPVWHLALAAETSTDSSVLLNTAGDSGTERASVSVVAGAVSPVIASTGSRPVTAVKVVVGGWMAGSAIAFIVLLVGLTRLSWIRSRSRRVKRGRWSTLTRDLSRAYRLRRPVTVLQSDHPALLFTWGFWRPTIVLPRGARKWTAERARIVLTHELAHIRRGDWIAQMFAEVLRSVYWFNPLVWMVSRRLRDESERACDDAVMRQGVEGDQYAAELIAVARVLNAERQSWVPAPAMARRSSLERRVTAMMNDRINRRPLARSSRAAIVSGLAAVALAIAGLTLTAQTFASFSGSVLDQVGGIVAGASLSLTNKQTGQKYEVKSSDVGSFEFVGLTTGEYEMRTGMPGFRSNIGTITIGAKNLREDVRLRVGSLEETITVVSAAGAQPAVRAPRTPGSASVAEPAACVPKGVGGVIAQPAKIADARPMGPGKAGVVVLNALIGIDGTVKEATPVDASVDPDLAASAVEAVKLWRYTPTLLNCVPIEVEMKVTALFRVE